MDLREKIPIRGFLTLDSSKPQAFRKGHRKALSTLDPLSRRQVHPLPTVPHRMSQTPLRPWLPKMPLKATSESIVHALQCNTDRKVRQATRLKPLPTLQLAVVGEAPLEAREEKTCRRSSSCTQKEMKASSGTENLVQHRIEAEATFRLTMESVHAATAPAKIDKKERARKALSTLKHFVQLGLPHYYITKLRLFVPTEAFAGKHSYKFLMCCRTGDKDTAQKLLLQNRWLCLDFDKVRKTGLHWAARRNHSELVDSLLRAGAFIDARDCIGRTALFLAARAGSVDAVRVLLAKKANAFLRTFGGKAPLAAAKDPAVRKLLIRSMQLSILMKFAEASERRNVWEREGLAFFRASLGVIHDS